MSLTVSYNLAIRKFKPDFYDKTDIIRLNSPWHTKDELINVFESVDKPKFVDVNIKRRNKDMKVDHNYEELLALCGKYNVEWVGISNVEDDKTYQKVRKLLDNTTTKICAKIETELGCWHIDRIMSAFDGIMVDNEDLATDMGWKRATEEKDRIYELCEKREKPHFRLAGVIFEHIEYPKIVYTYGAWDLLHPGHIKMLEIAKSYGDKLYVGVVGDDAIDKLKSKNGDKRPLQILEDRIKMIGSLSCVDVVIEQTDYDPVPNMKKILPDILVKGDDWEKIPGSDFIESIGGKLIKPKNNGEWSTSKMIKKIKGE